MYFRAIACLFMFMLSFASKLTAQIPTSCFEIESILVDACGFPEPENEMVRFRVGPSTLNIADINVAWPNNSYQGICKNAGTAATVAAINAGINGCGLVLEPVADVFPPGAKVVLVGSVNMIVSANTFQFLTDTIYMIFQCAGNSTSGHFKNYEPPPSAPRTLTMDFGPGCTETVSYLPSQLVNTAGQQTTADGAFVDFTWSGTPSFGNNGCQAIVQTATIDAQVNDNSVCQGDTITVNIAMQNFTPSSYTWSGGSGTFINASASSTQYIIGAMDAGQVILNANATSTCGSPVNDTVSFTVNGSIISSLQPSPLPPYCKGDVVTLSAAGGVNYQWSTGEASPSIQVTTDGTYSVTVSNECFAQEDSLYMMFSEVTADFTTDVVSGAAPLPVAFSDESSINAVSWNWDFGDGYTSVDQYTNHTYTVAGLYNSSLRVTNLEGCESTAFREIIVTGDTATFIPSAFSPNSDTKNEVFRPLGTNVLVTTGVIYNRWGQVVFKWNDSEGWNGFDTNGKKAAEGIYVYDVHSTYVWGETQRIRGWVMLVR